MNLLGILSLLFFQWGSLVHHCSTAPYMTCATIVSEDTSLKGQGDTEANTCSWKQKHHR